MNANKSNGTTAQRHVPRRRQRRRCEALCRQRHPARPRSSGSCSTAQRDPLRLDRCLGVRWCWDRLCCYPEAVGCPRTIGVREPAAPEAARVRKGTARRCAASRA